MTTISLNTQSRDGTIIQTIHPDGTVDIREYPPYVYAPKLQRSFKVWYLLDGKIIEKPVVLDMPGEEDRISYDSLSKFRTQIMEAIGVPAKYRYLDMILVHHGLEHERCQDPNYALEYGRGEYVRYGEEYNRYEDIHLDKALLEPNLTIEVKFR